jgi:hypothetical protein
MPFTAYLSKRTVAVCCWKKFALWQGEEKEFPQVVTIDSLIAAVLLTDKFLVISAASDLFTMDVSSLTQIARHTVGVIAESIRASSYGKVLVLFGSAGTLQFWSAVDGKMLGPARQGVWNTTWASDSLGLFAALQRPRFSVFDHWQPEDAMLPLSPIAAFRNLEILCVDLIRLMQDPHSGSRLFKTYPT